MKLILILLLLVSVAGCVSEPTVDLKTPEGLFKLGNFYQEQARYQEAINQYKALSNKHPYSPLAVQAQLKVGDCHYERQEYPESFTAYKLFKDLHPTHKKIDYATYRAGESIYQQLPTTVDRDLTQARQAIVLFQEVANVYPQSDLADDAKEKYLKLMQMLADKEIYVANFYFKQKAYLRALTRYELFMKEYPKNIKTPFAILRAALSAKKLDINDKAQSYKSKLLRLFPKTKEAQEVKKKL